MLHMRQFALISQSILVAAVSAAGLLAACSSDADRSFANGQAGAAGAGAAGSNSAAAGSASAGRSGSSAGGNAAAGASTASAGSGGTPSAGAGVGGTPSGTAGVGTGGTGGTAGSGGVGVAGAAPAGGAGSACPADATFCSGFEVSTLPTGAVYKANAAPGEWTRDFEVDSTLFHSGKSSLRVKSGSEAGGTGMYRMLAVPAPSGAFWVRFYIQQTELDLGGAEHNTFASAAVSDDPNAAGSIEFAEDVGLAFNTSDAVRWPTGYGRLTSGDTKPFTLPKGMWHCIEISFDGQGREQQLFINGMQQIDAKDYPAAASAPKIFKFGFLQFHGPARKVWFDDVAVAPTRVKCL
jgi:polysaccharide lyase-like protein